MFSTQALSIPVLSDVHCLGATFGTLVTHSSPIADLVADEARKRLYVVDTNAMPDPNGLDRTVHYRGRNIRNITSATPWPLVSGLASSLQSKNKVTNSTCVTFVSLRYSWRP